MVMQAVVVTLAMLSLSSLDLLHLPVAAWYLTHPLHVTRARAGEW